MKKILLLALIVVVVGLVMEDRLKSDFSGAMKTYVPTLMSEHTLYSWTNGGQWYFAIVTKGQRARSIEEIKKSSIVAKGIEGLKTKLDQLPHHQRIVWRAQEQGLSLPPNSMISQIKLYCDSNGFTLEIDRSRSSR